MGDRVDKKEIQRASEVHPIDYLEAKGESFKRTGQNYFKNIQHDSLVIHTNGKWKWNSRNQGGYGAISLAQLYYGLKFQDAVRDVNNQSISRSLPKEIEPYHSKEFEYPKSYEVSSTENIKNYLVNERMLDEKIVIALVKKDLLAEDKMKNGIFKWKDSEGKIVGGDRQGTVKMENKRGTFKNIMANSKTDGGFRLDVGEPNKIALFESPIDALSYFDLKRPTNIRLQSMSGLKDETATSSISDLIKDCKKRGMAVEKVIFAVDNDAAGEDFIERWSKLLPSGEIDKPKLKDWNDDLVHSKLEQTKIQNKKSVSQKEVEYER